MSEQKKVGITGIGGYGRFLLELLLEEQRRGGVELAAAVVSFPEQDAEHLTYLQAQSPGTRIFATLDEAVAAGLALDLMVLPVGIAAHKELTLQALAAGWNVLVEKPLAGSVEDAEAMVAADETSDRFVAVGYQDMYGAAAAAMKRALVSGLIGTVESVRVAGFWGRPVEYFQRNGWAGRLLHEGLPVFDSPFNNAMAHFLNLALFLAGREPDSVAMPTAVSGSMWRAHEIESCDTANLYWETDSGPEVAIFFSHTGCEQQGPELIVRGTSGELYWKFNSHWELRPAVGEPVRFEAGDLNAMRKQMLLNVLQKTEVPSVAVYTPRQALAQVQAVAWAHERIPILNFPDAQIQQIAVAEGDGPTQAYLTVSGLEEVRHAFFAFAKEKEVLQ